LPSERFQSADEVLGALRQLHADTVRSSSRILTDGVAASLETRPASPRRWRRSAVVLAAVVVTTLAVGAIRWFRPAVPPAPPEPQHWYERGTEALREGAFHSAATALQEAIRVFPDFPLAYARLAEARMEIDDESAARQALVELGPRVPDVSRLPRDE